MKRFSFFLSILLVLALISGCTAEKVGNAAAPSAPQLPIQVIARYPHDRTAFTQGLLFDQGFLYESTGLMGQSSVRKVELKSGKVLLERRLPSDAFGEGLALLKGTLLQLTWKNGRAYLYDQKELKPLGTRSYSGEGWGLSSDGASWISSDGSDALTWRDANSFAAQRTLRVTWDGNPVTNLNELEWIEGQIWANIWFDNRIIQIDPQSGKVQSYIDISGLVPAGGDSENVPNGIAYDSVEKRIFVTGKRWPVLYEITTKAAAAK